MMVKAASVLLKRRWARSSCRRSRAISDCSAVGRPTLAPADLPARTPPSRSRRHSVIWEEYSPCWRRYAPPWPWVRAASYAARCSSFCAGVNDRRRVGPPKRGCEGSIRPSWGTGVSVEELIRNQSESRPAWDGLAVNRWPQLTLARRGSAIPAACGGGSIEATGADPQSLFKASLTFSPACLRLLLVWSIWPSRSICSSSVALPSCSLAAPFVSSFLFFSLSVQPITGLHSRQVHQWRVGHVGRTSTPAQEPRRHPSVR